MDMDDVMHDRQEKEYMFGNKCLGKVKIAPLWSLWMSRMLD
jgi:hypothetical protein